MKGGQSHDIVLKTRDKELGLMLWQDENNKKAYTRTEAGSFAPRMSMDSASYAQFPPEQEVVIAFDNWTGGMGQYKYGREDKYTVTDSADTRFPNMMIAGPLITVTKDSQPADIGAVTSHNGLAEVLDSVFCIAEDGTDTDIWEWDNSNGYWVSRKTVASVTTPDGIIGYATWGVAAVGGSIYYSTNKTAWTEKASTDCSKGMAVVKGVLWGASATGVRSCTDPSGVWSTNHVIGDSWADVTSVINCNDVLYVGKEDGLWSFDLDKEKNLTPEYRTLKHANNFAAIDSWYGKIYAGVGESGLICYDPIGGTIQNISPARMLQSIASFPTDTKIHHKVGSICHDENWLYVIIRPISNSVRDSTLLSGRWMPSGEFVWYCLGAGVAPITGYKENAYSASLVTTINGGNPILWLGCFGASTSQTPSYFTLAKRANPKLDTVCTFSTSSKWVSSWIDFGFVDVPKGLLYIACETEACSATEYIEVMAQTDEESGTWFQLGEIYKNGKTSLFFKPMSDDEDQVTCRRLRIKVGMTTAGSTATPILRSLAVHAVARFPVKNQFNFIARCSDNVPGLIGITGPHTAKDIAETLYNFRKMIYPITLEDPNGVEWDVSIVDLKDEFVSKPPNKHAEYVFYVTAINQVTEAKYQIEYNLLRLKSGGAEDLVVH